MNLDDLNREAGALTRRRLMQLGAAGAMSLGAPRLAQAAETAVHRSMINVPFEKREPRWRPWSTAKTWPSKCPA
jgi:hypothetical protein